MTLSDIEGLISVRPATLTGSLEEAATCGRGSSGHIPSLISNYFSIFEMASKIIKTKGSWETLSP